MKLIGTGSALPKKVVTNAMLSEFLDTSDEWIVPRTGIHTRHVISDEELKDLGAQAALKALEMAGLKPEDIAQIELATDTPDSLQQEMADGLTLESTLGTEPPEDGLVERIALREAIDQLPEKERMTILLRYFKSLTQEQTARILGVSQVQVSRLERRSLQKLREYLAD